MMENCPRNAMTRFKVISSLPGSTVNDAYAKKGRFDIQLDDGIRWRNSAEAVSMEVCKDTII